MAWKNHFGFFWPLKMVESFFLFKENTVLGKLAIFWNVDAYIRRVGIWPITDKKFECTLLNIKQQLRIDGSKFISIPNIWHIQKLWIGSDFYKYIVLCAGNKFKEDWLLQQVIRKLGENYLIHSLQNSNYFSGRIACSKFDRKIIKCNWRVGVDYFPP